MKNNKIIIALMVFTLAGLCSCQTTVHTNSNAFGKCHSKGYKTWFCGYERPTASYRAMLR